MLQIRLMAIALLTQEDGISQEAYDLLYDLLEGDDDITQCVEATDGRFYLPDGWVDEQAATPVGLGYMEKKLRAIGVGSDNIQTDNDGQLVVYTGQMLNEEGHIVDYEMSEDASGTQGMDG